MSHRRPSTRPAELEAQIRRLTETRDAQASDSLYGLSYQSEIDEASIELAAWRLSPREMARAEGEVRDAVRRWDRAKSGRARGPVVAGVTGTGGLAATAGHLVADAGGLPMIGGGLLLVAAAALVLTVRDHVDDSATADEAETDVAEAQDRYAALVAAHGHAINPFRVALPATQEAPCIPQPATAVPTEDTGTPTRTAGAVTAGPRPTDSPTSDPASSAPASAA